LNDGQGMPEDTKVDKTEFDALLRKIATTPALKPEDKKAGPIEGRAYNPKKAKPESSPEIGPAFHSILGIAVDRRHALKWLFP
jgi:hypothetical protein